VIAGVSIFGLWMVKWYPQPPLGESPSSYCNSIDPPESWNGACVSVLES